MFLIDQQPNPNYAFLNLKFSKTDQFGKGCKVVLARSSNALCPVSALMRYLHLRGRSPGPLFRCADGSALTKEKLNYKLQNILKKCGWPQTFTLHSFRVGAATTAAA